MDRGEGQQWNKAPGNLYSTPKEVTIDPAKSGTIAIVLDQVIPPIPEPATTKYVKHEKLLSERLSKFWGRPMYLGAHILLPEGFDAHPNARYPLVINHGHFPDTIGGWREEPPDPNLPPKYSERFHREGYNRTEQELAYQLYKDWTAPDYPRYLLVEIQHANPYYDDSYAVNSQNLGPYGDAITYELIPYLEKKYRALGAGWARFMYGGSTGGWEALAAQVLYPDEYNGCWAACPDPIDFRQYTVVNIYEDRERLLLEGPVRAASTRPAHRNYLGPSPGDRRADQPPRARARARRAARAASGTSGRRSTPRSAPTATRSRSGTSAPESSTRTVAAFWKENYDLVDDPESRLDQGARPEARRQDPHLRRRNGQLLPEQRGLPRRGLPPEHDGARLRAARSTTARAPSTAGTATTRGPTRSRGCATTRCSRRRSSSGSRRARPRERT